MSSDAVHNYPKISELCKKQSIIILRTKDSIATALSQLAEKNISSAPVIDDAGKIHGFVDVIDLMLHLIRVCSKEQKSNVTPPSTKLTTDDIGMISRRSSEFYLSAITDAIGSRMRHDPYYPLHYDQTLKEAVSIFCKGVHRIAVTDDHNKIVNILSQSDVIRFLAEDTTRMGLKAELEVQKMNVPKAQLDLYTIPPTMMTIDAFRFMRGAQVTSLGIQDKGMLVGTLSATDLKGLKEWQFMRLLLPVMEFIAEVRKEQGKNAEYVVRCEPNTQLKTAVKRLASEHVHRLFVVDDKKTPLGVISLTDVIREIYGAVDTAV